MTAASRSALKGMCLVLMAVATLVSAAGCSRFQERQIPTAFPTQVIPAPSDSPAGPATAVVLLDSSGSVLGQTDLLAAAQNRTQDLVKVMPVGGRVAVRAFNNNVTAACEDLMFTLPQQNNPDMEDQIRTANLAVVGPKINDFLDCSKKNDQGGTELFGGLAEAFTFYPTAAVVDVYTDGCENVSTENICNPHRLQDPTYAQKLVDRLDARLVPTLGPGVVITFHGIGRGTNLDAASVATLRALMAAWAARTGATARFVSI